MLFGSRYPNPSHHQGTGIIAPVIRWTARGCDRKGDTRYTERLSSLGDCPPVFDCGGAPLELMHTVQIWLSRFVYRAGGIVDGTQAQRQRALSFIDSAISCQLSGYLLGLGIAVKAHLSKILRSLCYRSESKFNSKLSAVNLNFNAFLILPQEFCQ